MPLTKDFRPGIVLDENRVLEEVAAHWNGGSHGTEICRWGGHSGRCWSCLWRWKELFWTTALLWLWLTYLNSWWMFESDLETHTWPVIRTTRQWYSQLVKISKEEGLYRKGAVNKEENDQTISRSLGTWALEYEHPSNFIQNHIVVFRSLMK